jgi:hypothetical protein
LVNAYIGKGDDLRRQTKFDDAQTFYTRADQVRPNDQTIAARIRDTNDERTRNAAPPPPPTVPPPPTLRPAPVPTQPSPADIERVIRAYYGALTAGRYEEAYAVLSPQAQQAQPLSEFRRRLAPTSTFAVRSIEPPTIQGTTARARVHTQTTAAQGSSVGCSFIDWSLVLLDSTWRRNVISGSGNEGAESC